MDERVKINLEESCLPHLQSGEYVVAAQVQDNTLGNSESVSESFYVDGPRFSLAEGDVVSVYPGENMTGSFGDSLAHVVLARKTLPWERSINPQHHGRCMSMTGGTAPTKEPPWLCVLLLRDREIVSVSSGKVDDVIHPSGEIYFPELFLREGEGDGECKYIDLSAALFREIVPSPGELALLAHAREKDTDGEEDWVAVTVGNRLPAAGEEGIRNRAYLVSLEGFGDYDKNSKLSDYGSVRLIVLHSWEFNAVPEPLHFLQFCEGLDVGRFGGSQNLAITENGFLPLIHHLRQGSQTVSFYRGPFTPSPVDDWQDDEEKVWCSDALYRYDPELGMFDVSYAAAWQLGRLLALGNPPAARNIQKLRAISKAQCNRKDTDGFGMKGLLQMLEEEGGNLL